MPDDTELAPAERLSRRYGCVVIDGTDGWWAQRGEQRIPMRPVPEKPPVLMPVRSWQVLESYLMNARIEDIHAKRARNPSALNRTA